MDNKKPYEVPEQEIVRVSFETNYMATGDDDVTNPGGEVEPGGWN